MTETQSTEYHRLQMLEGHGYPGETFKHIGGDRYVGCFGSVFDFVEFDSQEEVEAFRRRIAEEDRRNLEDVRRHNG